MRLTQTNTDYASKGVAGSGLGLGIAGTALGVLNSLGNGINLTGGFMNPNGQVPRTINSEDEPVNRYEAAQNAKIATLETEIKLRDANTYTDQKLLEVYGYVDGRLRNVEAQICQQNVYNATNTSTLNCMAGQIAQLQGLTKIIVPASNVCPEPMARYNSWTDPSSSSST